MCPQLLLDSNDREKSLPIIFFKINLSGYATYQLMSKTDPVATILVKKKKDLWLLIFHLLQQTTN